MAWRAIKAAVFGCLMFPLAFGAALAGNAPLRASVPRTVSVDASGGAEVAPVGPDRAAAVFAVDGDLTLQFLSAAGAPAGAAIPVTVDGGSIFDSGGDVATLSTGNLAVVWQGRSGASEPYIFLQIFRPDGTRLRGETRVNAKTAAPQEQPQVAALPGGGFVVVWRDDAFAAAASDVRGQAFSSTGVRVGAEFAISGPGNAPLGAPSVAGVTGGFLVAVAGGDQILVQRFNGRGARLGGPRRVDVANARRHENVALAPVAAAGGVGAVVAWAENRYGTVNGLEVYLEGSLKGRFLSPTAAPGPVFSIVDADYPDGTRSVGGIVGIGPDALLAFTTDADGQLGSEARAVRVDRSGVPGKVFPVNGDGTDSQFVSAVALLGTGKPIVLFDDRSSRQGSELGLVATILAPPVVNATPIRGDNGPDRLKGTAKDDVMDGLGGDDTLSGAGGDDTLRGGAGADSLIGGTGADLMIGGQGDDRYAVDNSRDRILERAGEGADVVTSSVTYTLPANVETLILTGTRSVDGVGNATANRIIGTDIGNTLEGLGGPDTLEGRGGADRLDGGPGADTMIGGPGDDSYFVDSAADRIVERPGEGQDGVLARASFVLPDNVESISALGAVTVTGNDLRNLMTGFEGPQTLRGMGGDDELEGNAGDDTLSGGDGADRLNGGPGNDRMTGGAGTDLLRFDSVFGDDVVTDFSPADRDTLNFGGVFADRAALFQAITTDGDDTLIVAPGFGTVRLLNFIGLTGDDAFAD